MWWSHDFALHVLCAFHNAIKYSSSWENVHMEDQLYYASIIPLGVCEPNFADNSLLLWCLQDWLCWKHWSWQQQWWCRSQRTHIGQQNRVTISLSWVPSCSQALWFSSCLASFRYMLNWEDLHSLACNVFQLWNSDCLNSICQRCTRAWFVEILWRYSLSKHFWA